MRVYYRITDSGRAYLNLLKDLYKDLTGVVWDIVYAEENR